MTFGSKWFTVHQTSPQKNERRTLASRKKGSRLTVSFTDLDYHGLEWLAEEQDVSMGHLVRQAVAEFLTKEREREAQGELTLTRGVDQ